MMQNFLVYAVLLGLARVLHAELSNLLEFKVNHYWLLK